MSKSENANCYAGRFVHLVFNNLVGFFINIYFIIVYVAFLDNVGEVFLIKSRTFINNVGYTVNIFLFGYLVFDILITVPGKDNDDSYVRFYLPYSCKQFFTIGI